jgi:hypothetical protein
VTQSAGQNQEAQVNCPNCNHDLSEGAERCPACSAELTWVDDGEDPADGLVTVLESGDSTLIPVVRSLLEAEGIPCRVEHELLQDWMFWGRLGMGYSVAFGPVRLVVAAGDEEEARGLLAHRLASPEVELET